MCEIILLYYLQKQIGETYERSGRDSTMIRILFVVSWFVAEIFCGIVGLIITGDGLAAYAFAVVGVVSVVITFFIIANSVSRARRSGERTYMDDYNEYRTTGRVSERRRAYDDEDDEDDRPRRPRYDDDDRPRRSSRDDDRPRRSTREDDDRPRRSTREDDDRPRRTSRDDDDRPRRPSRDDDPDDRPRRRRDGIRREDEDY